MAPTSTLNDSGDWSNSGAIFDADGGTVALTGTNQRINGSTTFNNLSKTVAGADTLTFQAGATQTITGVLTLQGSSTGSLALRSSSAGVQWLIDPQGSSAVAFVDVQDSDNVDANSITAAHSHNSGNNSNWVFAVNTLTWTGAVSSDWGTAANWDLGYVPNPTDAVIVASVANSPVLDASTSVAGLTIQSGTSLNLAGQNFSDTGTFANLGTVVLQGTETVNLTQDVGHGAWEYVGDGSGSVIALKDFGSADYFNLVIDDTHAGKDTFRAGAGLMVAGSFQVLAGTYDANGFAGAIAGPTTINGGTYLASTATQSFNGGLIVSAGAFNSSTGQVVAAGVSVTGGILTAPATTLTDSGNWTVGGTGVFNANGGTVLLTGVAQSLTSAGQAFNNLSHNSIGTLTLVDDLSVPGAFSNVAGDVDATGRSLSIGGSWTWSTGNLIATGSTVAFTGSGTQMLDSGGVTLNNVSHTGGGILQLANHALSVGDTLTNASTAGNLNANNQSVTITGLTTLSGGNFLAGTATVSFSGGLTLNGGNLTASAGAINTGALSIAAGSLVGSTGPINATSVSLSGGSLTAPSTTLTDAGNWSSSGTGVFNGNGGTVAFSLASGTQQLDGGSLTFNNVSHTGAGTLEVANNALTVAGTFANSAGTFNANGLGVTVSVLTSLSGGAYQASTATQNFSGGLTIAGGALNASSGTIKAGALSISAGAFNGSSGQVNATSVSLTGGSLTASSTPLTDSGAWSMSGAGAFTASGTTVVTVAGATTLGGGSFLGGAANVSFNGGLTVSGGTLTASSATVNTGVLVISAGSFNGSTGTINATSVSLSGGALTAGSGTFNTGALSISAGAFNGSTGPVNATSVALSGGALTAPSTTLTDTGNWSSDAGAFIGNGGTVVFSLGNGTQQVDGGSQSLGHVSHAGAGILDLVNTALSIAGTLSNSAGIINANGLGITVSGLTTLSGGVYQAGAATQNFSGGLTISGGVLNATPGTIDTGSLSISAGSLNGSSGPINATSVLLTGGSLTAPTTTLSDSGNWTGAPGLFLANGGTVALTGTNQQIDGSTTFNNLSKIVASADTLTFQAGATQTVTGTVTLEGIPAGPLALRSSSAGVQWLINPQGGRAIAFVDVEDSDNVNAAAIAVSNAHNSGDNTNWTFAVNTLTWTGAASTDWGTAANWILGYVPNATDTVIIASAANNPVLDGSTTVAGLTIQAGARLNLSGQNFSDTGTFSNMGTFALRGTETVNLTQDLGHGAWQYCGDGTGSVIVLKDFGSTDYFNLVIDDTHTVQDTFRAGAALTIAGTFQVESGIFDANGQAVSVTGATTLSGGTSNATGGTQTFTGGLTISGGTLTASSGAINAGNLSISAGALNATGETINASSVAVTGGSLTATASTLTDSGNWSSTGAGVSFSGTNGTVVFSQASGAETIDSGVQAFNNVSHTGAATLQPINHPLTVGGTLTNSAGSFSASGQIVTVSGLTTLSGGTYLASTATQNFNGGLTVSGGALTASTGTINTGALSITLGTFTGASGTINAAGVSITGGTLTLVAATTLNDSGNWSHNGGTFTANGGSVVLTGTGPQITGSTTFGNLTKTVTSPDTLTFQAGSTQTISGTLTLHGSSGSPLALRSSIPGTRWIITPNGTRSIDYVDVQDSVDGGATAIAATTSHDTGDNSGRSFGSNTETWMGTASTSWGTPANWSLGYVPNATDTVIIPTAANEPVLDTARTVAGMTIQAAATLTLAGQNFADTGTFSNLGTVVLQGNETVSVTRDTGHGTFEYVGDGSGAIMSGSITSPLGGTYFNLVIDDTHAVKDTFRPLANVTVNGAFQVLSGTFDNGGAGMSVIGTTTVSGGALDVDAGTPVNLTGTTANQSNVVTGLPSTTGLSAGMLVSGLNVLPGTFLEGFLSSTSIVINQPTASSGAGTGTLTFTPNIGGVFFSTSALTVTTSGTVNSYAGTNTGALSMTGGSFDVAGGQVNATSVSVSGGGLAMNSGYEMNTGALSISGGSFNASGAINATSVSVTGGNLTASANYYLFDSGGWSIGGTGTFNPNGGYLNFDQASGIQQFDSLGQTFANFEHTGAGTLQLVNHALNLTGILDNTAGTFNANGQSVTVTGATALVAGTYQASTATQNFNGGLTISGGSFAAASGVVNAGGLTVSGGTFTASSGVVNAGALTISGTSTSSFGTFAGSTGQVNASSVTQTQTAGTLTAPAILNDTGNWSTTVGTFNPGTGTVQFSGGPTQTVSNTLHAFNNVTITGGNTLVLGSALSVGGTLTNAGTFNANNFAVTVTGLTTLSSGNYEAGTATQTFTGGLTLAGGSFLASSGTVAMGPLSISAGTFNGSGGPVNAASVTFSGGTLLGPTGTGTLSDAGNWSVGGAATFSPNGGTVAFTQASGTQTVDSGAQAFASVTHTGAGTLQLINNAFTVAGTLSTLTNSAGTFNANGLAVTVAGPTIVSGGTYLASTAAQSFNGGLTVSSTGTFTGSTGQVNVEYLSQSAGTLTAPSTILNVTGNWSRTAGTFTPNGGTVQFSLASGTQDVNNGTTAFNNVTHTGAGTLFLLTSALSVGGTLTNAAGNFNADNLAVTVTGLTTLSGGTYQASTATQTFTGGLTLSGGSLTASTGAVTTAALSISAGTFTGSTGSVNASSVTVTGGTLIAPSSVGTLTDAGNWSVGGAGVFTSNGGTVAFSQASGTQQVDTGSQSFSNVSHTGAGTLQLIHNALTATGTLINSAGTFNAGSVTTVSAGSVNIAGGTLIAPATFNVSGNWTKATAATFTANGGTVFLIGVNQSINGSTTFFNLNKTVSTADTLTFLAGSTTTVTGTLTLQGAAGNLLKLRSSTTGSRWNINPSGSRVVSFVDVEDSNNTNSNSIIVSPATSHNSGDNLGWTFM